MKALFEQECEKTGKWCVVQKQKQQRLGGLVNNPSTARTFFENISLSSRKIENQSETFLFIDSCPIEVFFSAPSYCMVCCCFYFLCFFKSQQAVRRLMNWTRRRTNKDRKRHDMNGNSGKTEGGRIEIFGNYAPRPRSIRGKNLLKIVSKSSSEK